MMLSFCAAARMVAKAVSERGGGLKRVEAMALQHAGVLEVACNLLDYRTSGPAEVQAAIEAAAAQHGIAASQGYCIGKLPEHMIELGRRAQQQAMHS
jgi:glutamate formiminotransferase